MFWLSLVIIIMSALLIQFGALSMQVAVQSVALKVILAVFLILAVLFAWYRFK